MVLAFMLLQFAPAKSQSYTYAPFPVNNFVWEGYTYFSAQSQSWVEYWTYSNQGDTVVNGITYHKIASGTFTREDSLMRVYLSSNLFSANEKLLYDFSLSVGDTLLSGQTTFVIDSVDTITYYNTIRKTLYSHWINGALRGNDVWIEGIGSNRGPLGVWHMYSGPGHNSVLCSAKENNDIKFQRNDGVSNNCSHFSGLDEISLSLYPNPVANAITISSENSAELDVFIYDAMGNNLFTQKNVESFPYRVSISHFPKGCYVLKVMNKIGTTTCRRFIVDR